MANFNIMIGYFKFYTMYEFLQCISMRDGAHIFMKKLIQRRWRPQSKAKQT